MTKGFIIYQTYKVENEKATIQLFGKLENNESFLIESDYKPYFYIQTAHKPKAKKLADLEYKETTNTNFNKEPLTKVTLSNPRSVPELRKLFTDNKIPCYEADIKFPIRFLIDHNIKSTLKIQGDYEKSTLVNRIYKNPKITPINYAPKLKILSFDIETDKTAKSLYSIALYSENFSKVLIIKKTQVKNAESFKDEKTLLERFKELIIKLDPDIITGWNVIDFDLRFLKEAAKNNNITLDIGRDKGDLRIYYRESFFSESKAIIPGRQVLDGISLLKNSFIKLDNYKLETAAKHFVGTSKIFEGKDRYKKIDQAYKNNVQTFIEYNLLDAKLAYQILKNSNTIDLTIKRSILTGIPLDGVRGSISSLDSLYLRELKKKKIVAPTSDFGEREERIKGGYVRDSKPGIYNNIIVLDFKSLYPSIIRTFNIDPLSYIQDPKKYKSSELIEAPNHAFFLKKEGILPKIIQDLWDQRDLAKTHKDELASYAIKILMNSFFGVLANPICRFYSTDLGNAITHFGQFLIKLCAEKIENLGYEVIYQDTDSAFVNSQVRDYTKALKIGKDIEVALNKFFQSYTKKKYGMKSYLQLEYEKTFKKFFMPKVRGSEKGAKKRYAGIVEENGKDTLQFTGLEFVRTDWTDMAKEFQKKLITKLFKGEKIETFIYNFVKEMKDGKHDHLLIYRKSIRKPVEEYVKTTPPHIKAARKIGRTGTGLIEYVITVNGPEAIEAKKSRTDYEHYINKQIKPIADSILIFFNQEFEDILKRGKQKSLSDF